MPEDVPAAALKSVRDVLAYFLQHPSAADSLEGIAKEVYEYHVKNLAPLGYKMRVEVLNYPGGVPGDIGIFFRW